MKKNFEKNIENSGSPQKVEKGLFIFHRDFRIQDNRGLIEASKLCNKLYTCFIFTPEQVGNENNYRSNNSIQFMIESLEELAMDIHLKNGSLMIFYGHPNMVVRELIKNGKFDGIYFNKDYSPYALKRDKDIENLCKEENIDCKMFSDYYLYEPGSILSGAGAYKKYTPFYERVIHIKVEKPILKNSWNFEKGIESSLGKYHFSLKQAKDKFIKENVDILVKGGRKNALERLKKSTREQQNYDKIRDYFITETTLLSAYIKFGCISVREVYHTFLDAFGKNNGLIRELLWREFFAHVLYSYPDVIGHSYQKKYRSLKWSNSISQFRKWCEGKTGYPIIDASMRQLNKIGYMHNRGRMTVASFLIKTLLIDWRWGERYFAQNLTDYDIASNNGNWQGISSTGVDMKPYFRDMNPWIQSNKFDKDAEFIKKWVPELKDVTPSDIHKWYDAYQKPEYKNIQYPKPIVDYSEQKEKMLKMYENT